MLKKKCSINFTENNKKICLSWHYNWANSYLLWSRYLAHVATPLCLRNIKKNWIVDNMRKTGLNGYVYDFSVDYDAIAVDDILDIYKYLIKKII